MSLVLPVPLTIPPARYVAREPGALASPLAPLAIGARSVARVPRSAPVPVRWSALGRVPDAAEPAVTLPADAVWPAVEEFLAVATQWMQAADAVGAADGAHRIRLGEGIATHIWPIRLTPGHRYALDATAMTRTGGTLLALRKAGYLWEAEYLMLLAATRVRHGVCRVVQPAVYASAVSRTLARGGRGGLSEAAVRRRLLLLAWRHGILTETEHRRLHDTAWR